MDLIIVGAGIAGSSAARIAREQGRNVVLVDPNPSQAASRAALATIRPQWFDKALRGTIDQSWNWYEKWGAAVTQYAAVSNWRNLDVKPQKDWWLVDPAKTLIAPDIAEAVTEIGQGKIVLASGREIAGERILIATGAYGGKLSPKHEPLWGATLVSTDAYLDAGPLRIHHLRPYHTLTVADVHGTIRLGSSIAKTEQAAITGVNHMLQDAIKAGIVNPDAQWTALTGVRARIKGNLPTLPQPGPVATIGNLARSGYAITPAVIEEWLNR